MSISLYAMSIPPMMHSLRNVRAILEKAVAYAEAKNIDAAILVNARLFPDMYPLVRQIQIATDVAKGAACRLSGRDLPKYEDNERSFAELIARLDKTLALLESITAEQFDGAEDKTIELPRRDRVSRFTGLAYVTDFVLPNVYFHVSMTYAILRHNGLEIGKQDYLGGV